MKKLFFAFLVSALAVLIVAPSVSFGNGGTPQGVSFTCNIAAFTDASGNYIGYSGGSVDYSVDLSNLPSDAANVSMQYYYNNNWQDSNGGLRGLGFITPPIDQAGTLTPVTQAMLGYVSNGKSYASFANCSSIIFYPLYQLFAASDSNANQINSVLNPDGSVADSRGINLTVTQGQSSQFNFSLTQNNADFAKIPYSTRYNYLPFYVSSDQNNTLNLVSNNGTNYVISKSFNWNLSSDSNWLNPDVSRYLSSVCIGWDLGRCLGWTYELPLRPINNNFSPTIPVNVDATNLSPGNYSGIITVYDTDTNPGGSMEVFSPTQIPVTVTVKAIPSNYTASCSATPTSTCSGGGVAFSAAATGSIIHTPLSYSWTPSCGSSLACNVNNVTSSIAAGAYSVKISDPYGYSASANCPAVPIITSGIPPEPVVPPTPVVSITGGPVFYVSNSGVSTNINITGAAANQLVKFIPEAIKSDGSILNVIKQDYSVAWPNPYPRGKAGNTATQFQDVINSINNGSFLSNLVTGGNGSYSQKVDFSCSDIGVWRIAAQVAGVTSNDAIFAIAPDPNATGTTACQ